jgi:hypothetical protein
MTTGMPIDVMDATPTHVASQLLLQMVVTGPGVRSREKVR